MLAEKRREDILYRIDRQGSAQIKHLSEAYGVSEMTIRRDLKQLAHSGLVKITHGGAVSMKNSDPLPEQLYSLKEDIRVSEKQAIARYAAEVFVQDDDVIVIDPGTTAAHMIPFLVDKTNLTVVTNGLETLQLLKALLPHANVICTGGILRDTSYTFVGPVAEQYFDNFFAKKYFVSSVGLHMELGLSDPQMVDTQVKKATLKASAMQIVLLDSSKFGIRSTVPVATLDQIDILITDQGISSNDLRHLEKADIKVCVVDTC